MRWNVRRRLREIELDILAAHIGTHRDMLRVSGLSITDVGVVTAPSRGAAISTAYALFAIPVTEMIVEAIHEPDTATTASRTSDTQSPEPTP